MQACSKKAIRTAPLHGICIDPMSRHALNRPEPKLAGGTMLQGPGSAEAPCHHRGPGF